MTIQVRVRCPSGNILHLQAVDDAKIPLLLEKIKQDTGLEHFSLKMGFPPVALDLTDRNATLAGLRLHGSTLTLTPADPPASSSQAKAEQEARDHFIAAEIAAAEGSAIPENRTERPDNLSVRWPEEEGWMVLRVMADDNSCLFTALSTALVPEVSDPAPYLRDRIARYILCHPETYTEVVLQKDPFTYARNLRGSQFWGGSIEMSVLSEMYDVQIVAVDVKTGQVFPHGENKKERCLVLYSGIHYDRIVFTPDPGYPPETDVTRFRTDDDSAVRRAKLLADKLRRSGYYTDPNAMLLRCEVPGCDWFGEVKAANQHSAATGHTAFDEIPDK